MFSSIKRTHAVQIYLLLINMNFCDGFMIILLYYSELYSEVLLKFLVLIRLNE